MKGKNKGKLEYIEEFRKITAIQKLPTLKQGFGDIFFQNKAQNSKFLRLKDQPFLSEIQLNSKTFDLCQNQFVSTYIFDNEESSKVRIYECIQKLNQQIDSYKVWAKQLTDFVQKGNYSYVFKSQRASPPVALSKEMQNFDPLAMQINNETLTKLSKTDKNKIAEKSVNMPNKLKRFDFSQITDYLITDDFKFEDLDGNVDLARKQIQLFREYRTIEQINSIEELKADYETFQYHAVDVSDLLPQKRQKFNESDHMGSFAYKNNSSFMADQQANSSIGVKKGNDFSLPELLRPSRTLQQKFKYLSLHRNQLDMNINFFRSLGPPSRNAENFIKNIILNDKKQSILQSQEQNPFIREKVDTCLLHFLEATQLKVDKGTLNFYDIENISMSRITSTNAHMCIRSEKVTRLQYQKLLKKMQKLYKMQHEDGKTRVHQAITTDQIDQDHNNSKGMKNDNAQNRPSLQKIVEEINAIRKEAYALENSNGENSFKFISPGRVKDEISKKMFSLLEELYKRVCQDLPFNYSILEIGLHVDQVDGLAEGFFETKKLIWFIMTVLEQIEKGKSVDKNITYLQNKNKKDDEPRVVKYKGDKLVAKDKMGTKHLFYNNPVATTQRQKSVSLIANSFSKSPYKATASKNNTKTPIKSNVIQKTPEKNLSKSPIKSTAYQQTQNRRNAAELTPNRKQPSTSPYQRSTNKKAPAY